MAFTVERDEPTVSKAKNGIRAISTTYRVMDGATEVLTIPVSIKHNPNTPDLAAAKASIQGQIKDAWDKYKAEQTLAGSALLGSALDTIATQATTYVNQ